MKCYHSVWWVHTWLLYLSNKISSNNRHCFKPLCLFQQSCRDSRQLLGLWLTQHFKTTNFTRRMLVGDGVGYNVRLRWLLHRARWCHISWWRHSIYIDMHTDTTAYICLISQCLIFSYTPTIGAVYILFITIMTYHLTSDHNDDDDNDCCCCC